MTSENDDSLICPITKEIFRDPVLAEDGRLYERAAITRWINEHGTSPFTRQVLNVNRLEPDHEVRKRAEQRRRLSVSYNRESDQVQLPPIRTLRNIRLNRIADVTHPPEPTYRYICCQNICPNIRNGGDHSRSLCSLFRSPKCIACVCVIGCILIPMIVVNIALATTRSQSSVTTPENSICNGANYNVITNSCFASFTNITTIYSIRCRTFTYVRMRSEFTASSSNTTIIFAFQQSSGYWDIDNITLWDTNSSQNLFPNGDFETVSLRPNYRQCQSTGNISNSSQFDGRYCYSDGTRGQFGYLLQTVSTRSGSWYYLDFYFQNRDGSSASFAILLGT